LTFTEGQYQGFPKRYGYRLEFMFAGQRGRLEVAALPIRKEGGTKRSQALNQALFTVREALEAQYLMSLLLPNSSPLLPYLLVPGTGKTVSQIMQEENDVPLLAGSLEGEWREVK
jgi:hypothetical protein